MNNQPVFLRTINDNEYIIVCPENVSLSDHRYIMGYFNLFRDAIAKAFYPQEKAYKIIAEYEFVLQKIADIINFDFKIKHIKEEDLYRFFVGRIEKTDKGKIFLRRSDLELFLGFSEVTLEEVEDSKIKTQDTASTLETTGDTILDVTTITMLNFKHNGAYLLNNFSLEQLSKINEYAAAVQKRASEEAKKNAQNEKREKPLGEKPIQLVQPVKLDDKKQQIKDKLKAKGIRTPKGY